MKRKIIIRYRRRNRDCCSVIKVEKYREGYRFQIEFTQSLLFFQSLYKQSRSLIQTPALFI